MAVPIMAAGVPQEYPKPWRYPGFSTPADTLGNGHLSASGLCVVLMFDFADFGLKSLIEQARLLAPWLAVRLALRGVQHDFTACGSNKALCLSLKFGS
jgi:hypothetical protein